MKSVYYAVLMGFCHFIHFISPKKKMYKPADES